MKYIRFNLKDDTPVKFRLKILNNDTLVIEWKYANKILDNIKNIYINFPYNMLEFEIDKLERCTNKELIDRFKDNIYSKHYDLKTKKRTIKEI